MEQGIEVTGVDHENSFLFGSHALVNEVAGDLQSRLSGTLAVTGLEHIELAVLDGELHVLHIAVVVFERLADVLELLECFGEQLCHLCDGKRSTDACNDVFALCIGQEFAHQLLFAGCGITGESNTGAAVVAHVTECHHLHVDSGAPGVGDIVVAAVDIRTGVVPGTEHGFDCADELFLRIGREIGADLGLIFSLELVCKSLEVIGVQLDVELDALFRLHLVDELLEVLLADFHNDVGIHLDKSSVAVPSPSGVTGLVCDDLHDILVQTEVEDGVHHAGHRCTCAGADGNEKRILLVAELLAGDLLHLCDVGHDLSHDAVIDLSAVLVILRAGFGGDGEALRDRKSDVGHFSKVCAFTAEQLAHIRVAFGKQVAILVCHLIFLQINDLLFRGCIRLPVFSSSVFTAILIISY